MCGEAGRRHDGWRSFALMLPKSCMLDLVGLLGLDLYCMLGFVGLLGLDLPCLLDKIASKTSVETCEPLFL